MLQILGFMTGAALAIGTIVVVMGTPELIESPTADATDQLAFAVNLPAESQAPAVPEPVVEPEPITDAEPVIEPEPPVEAELLAELDLFTATDLPAEEFADPDEMPPTNGPPTDESLQTPAFPIEPEALFAAEDPAAHATNPQWHSFWNPFRSQIAANGFAARLTAVTDIDYRVVRLKPGVYQVAFAYTDDSERAAKLAQIESATGLNMPEAMP